MSSRVKALSRTLQGKENARYSEGLTQKTIEND